MAVVSVSRRLQYLANNHCLTTALPLHLRHISVYNTNSYIVWGTPSLYALALYILQFTYTDYEKSIS